MHAATSIGNADAVKLLLEVDEFSKRDFEYPQTRPDVGFDCTPLDQALLAGSPATVKACYDGMLFHNGPHSRPQQAAEQYVRRDQGAQLAALLVVDGIIKPRHGIRGQRWGRSA